VFVSITRICVVESLKKYIGLKIIWISLMLVAVENVICIHCCNGEPPDAQKVALFPSPAEEQGYDLPFMKSSEEQLRLNCALGIKLGCGGGGDGDGGFGEGGGGLGGSGEGGGGSGDGDGGSGSGEGGGGGGGSGKGGGGGIKYGAGTAIGIGDTLGEEESSVCMRPIVMPNMMPRATQMMKKISTTAFSKVDDLCCWWEDDASAPDSAGL
jgi:hypothetical protein